MGKGPNAHGDHVGHGFRYPDGFVACTPGAGFSTIVTDPVVIFEVLSPSTASIDQITKSQEYAAIASVRRYVILAQDRIGATVFERAGDDWIGHVIAKKAMLSLPEIGVELPLAELYDGVVFEAFSPAP
ncbi:MAG TPA: Uma2 family endonuclease [Roseomonas sp.]